MRRNIFDILEEEMNLEYEIETIVNLFNEARIYGFNINYSIEDYFTMILPFPKDLAMPRTKRSLSRGRKEIYFTASSPKVSPLWECRCLENYSFGTEGTGKVKDR